MRVLLHFRPPNNDLVGVWWLAEDGQPRFLYSEDAPEMELSASVLMEAKFPDVSWESFWQHLQHRQPFFDSWETFEVPSDTDMEAFLLNPERPGDVPTLDEDGTPSWSAPV